MEMRPTSVRMLAGVALACALIGWAFANWVDGHGRLPQVPWLAVVIVWVVALFVGVWAVVTRRRLHPKPGRPRMPALTAARTAALALAGSRTGAVVLGVYGGTAIRLTAETQGTSGRERLLAASLAALGGLVLAGLSLWLEHLCRLPDDPDSSAVTGPGGRDPDGSAGAHARTDGAAGKPDPGRLGWRT